MLNATAISSAANQAPSPGVVGSLATQGNGLSSPSTPSFSQVFSGIHTGEQPTASKLNANAAPRAQRSAPQQNSQSQVAQPHTPKDSATQAGTASNPQASAPIAQPLTATNSPAADALAKIAAALSDGTDLAAVPISTANLKASRAATSAVADSVEQAGDEAGSSEPEQADDAADAPSADPSAALNGGFSASAAALDAKSTQANSSAYGTGIATFSLDAAQNAPHLQAPPQSQALSIGTPSLMQVKAAVAHNLQLQPDLAAAQRADQFHLPDAASIASASSNSTSGLQSSVTENREIVAQKVQTVLSSSLSSQQQGSAIQSALAANGEGSANNCGGGSTQNGGHSQQQSASQSSATSHSSDDGKTTSNSTASSSAQPNDPLVAGAQQSAAAAPAGSVISAQTATGVTSTNPHATAQALAQADASASASGAAGANVRSASNPTSSAGQSSASTSLPPDLPRSLSDVSQATQLYQRAGGGEMHIAMDTDLLGSIDLRAVVHQGSLSATIGVQRADVQTLLVNELPALQHSLAEKNLQVGQISVTAGSIGSGANPNAHSQDQQNRHGQNAAVPSAPVAPVYRDDVPRAPYSSAPLSEVAGVGSNSFGISAKLSVHA